MDQSNTENGHVVELKRRLERVEDRLGRLEAQNSNGHRPEDERMGTADVMQALGIRFRTVYAMIDDHGLRAYRIGRVIRVRRADLEQWIERQRITAGELAHLHPGPS
jgi:excisionase family DNA binding protein